MVGDFQVSGSQPVLAPGDLKRVRERISWDGEDPPPEGRICVWPQLERMKLWQARQYWAAVIAHDRWIRETFPEGSEFWEVTREA